MDPIHLSLTTHRARLLGALLSTLVVRTALVVLALVPVRMAAAQDASPTSPAARSSNEPPRGDEDAQIVGERIARALQACDPRGDGRVLLRVEPRSTHVAGEGLDLRCAIGAARGLYPIPSAGDVQYELAVAGGVVRFVRARTRNAAPAAPPPPAPAGPMRTDAENAALDAEVAACWEHGDPSCVRRLLEGRAQTDRQFFQLTGALERAHDEAALCATLREHHARFPHSRLVAMRWDVYALTCDL